VWYTPPYHPEVQAIEIIWGVMKNSLAREVSSMANLGHRIGQAKEKITQDTWIGA
jgi:hypothetical protein